MEAVVRDILCDAVKDPRTLFKQHLAAPAPQQAELVAALLQCFDLNPGAGVQCLAISLVAAPGALWENFRHGDRLARVLRAGGGKAGGVADVATMVFAKAGEAAAAPGPAAARAAELWHALARLEGVQRWEDLRPSPVRAAAVKLWSKRPELAPPGASAAPLAKWLAQAAAPETEKGPLLAAVKKLWAENQAVAGAQAEDVLGALLQDMPTITAQDEQRLSIEWLATAVMGGAANGNSHFGASPWVCYLFLPTAGAIAAAAVEFLSAARGRAALLFAWLTLYGAVLGSITGSSPWTGDDGEKCIQTVLRLLGDICNLLASKECWRELVCALLCVVLRWPADTSSGPMAKAGATSSDAAPLLAVWAEFARSVLLELPDRTPEAPVASVLPLLLAALPEQLPDAPIPHAQVSGTNGAHPLCSAVAALAVELRPRASSFTASAGLQNLGNTCYLNSLLQALASTASLVSDLFLLFPPHLPVEGASAAEARGAAPPAPLPVQGAAARASLAQVLTRLAVARRPVSPSALASLTPFGLRGQQQDVTELARWLFEQLGDAEKEGSLVGLSFGGKTRTVVRCTACGHSQEKLEAFSDLSLSVAIPSDGNEREADAGSPASPEDACANGIDASSVAGLLRAYLCEEALSGYRCDACGAVGTSRRRCEITRPPRQLVVTLNRFAYTAEGGQEKVDARVAVDKLLELPLASPGLESKRNAMAEDDPETAIGAGPGAENAADGKVPEVSVKAACDAKGDTNEADDGIMMEVSPEAAAGVAEYSLYAFVTHAGSTPHSGHYVCIGRGSESPADAAWSRFDDASVRALPGQATQEMLDDHANGAATAYMLFYQRVDREAEAAERPPLQPSRRRLPARFFAEAILGELADLPAPGGARAAAAAALACLRRSLGAARRRNRRPAWVVRVASAAGAAAGSADTVDGPRVAWTSLWLRRCRSRLELGLSQLLWPGWPAVGTLLAAALAREVLARLGGWGPL